MAIKFSYYTAYILLFMLSVPCISEFSVRISDEQIVFECLANIRQPNMRHHALCRRFLHNARKYTAHLNLTREKRNVERDMSPTSGPENSVVQYLQALNSVANFKGSKESMRRAVKDVGTCGQYFDYVMTSWKEYFENRNQQRRYPIYPHSQTIQGSSMSVLFNSPRSYAKTKYNVERLSAVDVIVSHTPGSTTGEVFGEYRLIGELNSEDSNGRRKTVSIHNSLQSVCPSGRGRFFVGGFNAFGIAAVAKWFRQDNTASLQLKLSLEGEKMIIHCPNSSFTETVGRVSERVIAIILHFDVANLENRLTPQLMRVDIPDGDVRRRRSIPGCRRKTYVMNFNLHQALGVIDPTFFDVGECVGACEDQLQNLNSTNHAIGLQSEKHIWTPSGKNPKPSICCVPISYRNFQYLTEDEYGVIVGDYRDKMITEYCGCR